jgi:acetoacetate decarboxylase
VYGVASDLVDEYMCMSESTCFKSMYKFGRVVVQVFAGEYLDYCRSMSLEDSLVCLDA